jgi:uncharacterized protein YndB with AHSA1/START domain
MSTSRGLIATATTTIDAPIARVWDALVNPAMVRQYMFGTTVVSDWKQGSPIRWKGEWKGKPYEDTGTILRIEPEHVLEYSHFSPLAGQPDLPENYHTVTIELAREGEKTAVLLEQDNNPTSEAQEHSAGNWKTMLDGMKKLLEQ